VTDWLRTEIVTGLQKLLALRLPGSPAADTATATAEVWIEALSNAAIAWNEQLDRARVRAAFGRLVVSCDRWPAPEAFFRHLQARAYAQPALTSKMTDKQLFESRRYIRSLMDKFVKRAKSPKTPARMGNERK